MYNCILKDEVIILSKTGDKVELFFQSKPVFVIKKLDYNYMVISTRSSISMFITYNM